MQRGSSCPSSRQSPWTPTFSVREVGQPSKWSFLARVELLQTDQLAIDFRGLGRLAATSWDHTTHWKKTELLFPVRTHFLEAQSLSGSARVLTATSLACEGLFAVATSKLMKPLHFEFQLSLHTHWEEVLRTDHFRGLSRLAATSSDHTTPREWKRTELLIARTFTKQRACLPVFGIG